ncbi:conserved exported hypothetical protein [Carnobacterium maltaromaticum]|uniref:WxL domain-containing protein n=1 Tax=Carnobacterium maltaromaticum TaxID=2751 RepID=A0AAW9KAJ8_CARML|nr:WxL domain-containing protein [Carnobacterium maltaromaticum]MDZ5759223.1 WxL domain-containing protein [Carnobacterium maltaromaticum]CAD5898790.1 conserved exported hypothetical protein [Carnobacterium maltaromaticum]
MKKLMIGYITLVAVTSVAIGGNHAQAAVSSQGKSDTKIKFVAGDDVVTPPVNPKDPDTEAPNPVDPTDPDNPGTGEKGPLSVDYISNLKFGQHKISGKTITYNALNEDPFVQVTDLRGAGNGWSLSAKMSPFKSATNQELRGATLSMKNGVLKPGSSTNVSAPPIKSDVVFNNGESKLVMNAKDKGGRGTWLTVWSGNNQANESVQLNVLAGTPEANTDYTSSITWTLEDAPK